MYIEFKEIEKCIVRREKKRVTVIKLVYLFDFYVYTHLNMHTHENFKFLVDFPGLQSNTASLTFFNFFLFMNE